MSTLYHPGKSSTTTPLPAGATIQLKLGRLKALAMALLSEFEELGDLEPIDVSGGISLRHEVRRYEIHLIMLALDFTGGNQKRAAKLLGLKPTTLNSKIKQYRLPTKSNL